MAETAAPASVTSTVEPAAPSGNKSSPEAPTTAPRPAEKPGKPETKRWADEEDDPPEEPEKKDDAPAPSNSDPEVNLAELKITENKFLDDPEDSNISAVRSPFLSLCIYIFEIFNS